MDDHIKSEAFYSNIQQKLQITGFDLPRQQTMSDIVESCPLTKLNGGLYAVLICESSSSPIQILFSKVIGVRTLYPYNNSNGVNPVLSCGVSVMVHDTHTRRRLALWQHVTYLKLQNHKQQQSQRTNSTKAITLLPCAKSV